MKESSGDFRLPEGYPGENESHMAAFVRNRVFSTPDGAAAAARSLEDALEAVDLAVGFDEESIAFYGFAMDRVRESDRAAVERIIREEQRHIERLNDLRQKLARNGGLKR
jgi:rubrerythrin